MRVHPIVLAATLMACTAPSSGHAPNATTIDPAPATATLSLPPESCPVGTAPLPDAKECTPIGPACAEGFEHDASGWACVAIVPKAVCAGPTREEIGHTTCVDVGDCTSAFPPANATLFVESGATGAKHYATLQAAIDAAVDGDVIAVADGTYAENLLAKKADNLTIVGRCAAKATLTASNEFVALSTSKKLTLENLTVHGGGGILSTGALRLEDVVLESMVDRGIAARDGGSAKLVRSVIRNVAPKDNPYAQALYAEKGGVIELEASAIATVEGRGGVAFDEASRIALTRSVIRDVHEASDGTLGNGLTSFQGAHLEFTESAIVGGIRSAFILAHGAGTAAIVRSSIIDDRHAGDTSNEVEALLWISGGATIAFEESSIVSFLKGGIVVSDPGTKATVRRSAFATVSDEVANDYGPALLAYGGATLAAEDVVIHRAIGLAVHAWDSGTTLSLTHSFVDHMVPIDVGPRTSVVVGVDRGARVLLDRSTFDDNPSMVGLVTGQGSHLEVRSTLVRRMTPDAYGRFGIGLMVHSGGEARLIDTTIAGAREVAFVVSNARARFESGAIVGNVVGVHVQDGSKLMESDATDPNALEVLMSPRVRFDRNETRVGSGTMPLPDTTLPTL